MFGGEKKSIWLILKKSMWTIIIYEIFRIFSYLHMNHSVLIKKDV